MVQNKPVDLVDACWDGGGSKIADRQTYGGPGRCNRLYPSTSTPRMAAGGPLAGTVLACVLKPVDRSDYPAVLSSTQFARLEAAFPAGVCDWPRGGEGQRDLDGTSGSASDSACPSGGPARCDHGPWITSRA